MTVYVAGRITGDPRYRRKFKRAARGLRALGFCVLNPAILPPAGFSYAAYMRMTQAMLDECEAVALLPDWADSPGATAEYERAKETGKMILLIR
jgi:hypothetical protein